MCQMTHDRLDIPFLLLVLIVYATEKKNTKSRTIISDVKLRSERN
jgi:hypothetical protein